MFFTEAADAMREMGRSAGEIAEALDPVEIELDRQQLAMEVQQDQDEVTPMEWAPTSYLEAFALEHGAPLPHPEDSGRLLCADGWSFDAFNPNGPAYPPPGDPVEVKRLRVLYYQTRQTWVAKEVDFLRSMLLDPRHEACPSLFSPYRQQLAELEKDLGETAQALKELEQ